MSSWFDYTVNGLIIGNIYALLAVGLALIFGVSRLINFAHGSVYVVGAYAGFLAVTQFGTPLPLTIVIVVAVGALLGLAIERFGLRPLQGYAHIAPLLATIGISFVLDQLVQLTFSPDPRALPSELLQKRFQIGSGTIGALDILIAAIGIGSAGLLYYFLRFTRLGWAVRATAQDRDAAQQMGVDVDAVNRTVFAIASALGAVSGLLVGMYYNYIDPSMSFQATLKGVVAQVVGGVGNVPGAIAGSMLLGLVESYGIALFGTSYRNLFAFILLIVVLVLRPNGLFASRRQTPPEPMTGTFIAPSKPVQISPRTLLAIALAAALLPLVLPNPYVLQTLTNAWLYGLLGLSLTLIAGTVGLISLGHAALLAIGGYASALLSLDLGMPVGLSILLAGVIAAALGTLLVFPSFRLRGHYLSIATLAIGEIVSLVILNWDSLTRGPIGVSGIPPLSLFGFELDTDRSVYWFALGVLVVLAALQFRLLRSHLGRTLRAMRDDDIAARSYGIGLDRYKALAFAVGSFAAGVSGGITAHLYSYINHETFNSQLSILALTIVILGGMGNVTGAILGSVLLVGLPEVFRVAAEYRVLIYGIVLLLLVRFRPQGLLGTV
ncbi:branched-chain amino acid transport system permease protein [Enhydrobacter aerosaccus]|uniref:Branched-chain amino acid transport system permease protein n=1 Tax=Enhydrobacter aerosaccus TaxID=225324 RepID=A0A1T4T620_9HYPH|nr:ABC transporter permease [Enhydrobacter aerosaccus]SKA35837.1 branched-chain amino acid transport system permease protein [Enhydrobacter aerosaccus]